MPREVSKNIQIYPTTFYKRLSSIERNIGQEIDVSCLSKWEMMHLGVKKWTKDVDIFAKDLLLIPVCECSHWYLVVIILPGLLLQSQQKQETAIIVFDSLKDSGTRETTVKNVEHYLYEEMKVKKESRSRFKTRELPAVYPMCPTQDDATSCGVFLLHYAQMILSRFYYVFSG